MKKFIRIGIDLAKNYFQVHALTSECAGAVTRKLSRSKMREFFVRIEPCLIGMEACGSAHYWARELKAMGHEVRLMPGLHQALCQARQERRGRRGGDLRGGVAARNALRSDQEHGAASDVNAA